MNSKKTYRGFTKEHIVSCLREMMLVRTMEERVAFDYRLKKIGGFCHLCVGQEAVSVGSIATLDLSKDYVLTSYRDHGHAISCGLSPEKIIAELYGKATGCSRGKGGSMHLFNVEKNFLGGNGIVGAQIPIATGTAFAQKYKNSDGVTICYFGDGAINQGAFHESINLAQLWSLPCIYVVENNFYGMGTAVTRASSSADFSKAGENYGVSGKQINGMDFFEVHEVFKEVVARTRKKSTPFVIEAQTYRYYGHSMSDPAHYRTKEEVAENKARDPIENLKQELINNDMLTENEYNNMGKQVKEEIIQAQKFAEDSPEPSPESLYEDVLAN